MSQLQPCDLCGKETKRGLRAGRGVIWLCDTHYEATNTGVRAIAQATGNFVKSQVRRKLEQYPVAAGVIDFLSSTRKP